MFLPPSICPLTYLGGMEIDFVLFFLPPMPEMLASVSVVFLFPLKICKERIINTWV